jgi:hypothetical protein
MATKQQVIDLHAKHPDWTCYRIAEELGCTSAYVRATASREGLKLPPKRSGVDSSLLDLGMACRAAGLTLRDILDISEQRMKRA